MRDEKLRGRTIKKIVIEILTIGRNADSEKGKNESKKKKNRNKTFHL